MRVRVAAVVLLLSAVCTALRAQTRIDADARYAAVAGVLETFIAHELQQKSIPAASIALVDDQRVVWARGFGYANPQDSTPATAQTIYRVGSVSKLFTDIGIMQLVQQGRLDLDAPVTRYIPEFSPRNRFGIPITLRQLMSHRAGLTREPPVGNYFDDRPRTLAETVASLNDTELVYAPGTRTKYSNAGIAVAGYVLEKLHNESFYPYLKRTVLDPLGMQHSAFEPLPALSSQLAKGYMWSYDGKFWEAPTFQLGMGPCGSMYTNVLDLGRFLSTVFAAQASGAVNRPMLDTMLTPQFGGNYGLGFALGTLAGEKVFGHGGAIYGFATTLLALPAEKLGVVVVATLDGANAVTDRIAREALQRMRVARRGAAVAAIDTTSALPAGVSRALTGRFASAGRGVDLYDRNGRLFGMALDGGMRFELRAGHGAFIADDVLEFGTRVQRLSDDRIVFGRDTLARVTVPKPAPPPSGIARFIGEYGWKHNTLYILERDGVLNALIEWFFQYPLTQVDDTTFAFPQHGLYDGQQIVFTKDSAVAATVGFPKRALPGDDNAVVFRIAPRRPVEELRREALQATPPPQPSDLEKPDLVELRSLDPSIRYDIRYATTNNFISTAFYSSAHAFMQRPAAQAVARASRQLHKRGYGLLIHDSYRPWYVTKMFWEATPDSQRIFVADPAQGSRHNRGAAVDLTLYDLASGEPVRMTGGYDEFSDRSFPDYPGGTSLQRWQREVLRRAMEDEGFRVYDYEWWHFDFGEWRRYPVLNVRFEELIPK